VTTPEESLRGWTLFGTNLKRRGEEAGVIRGWGGGRDGGGILPYEVLQRKIWVLKRAQAHTSKQTKGKPSAENKGLSSRNVERKGPNTEGTKRAHSQTT